MNSYRSSLSRPSGNLFSRRWFWAAFVALSIAAVGFVIVFFPKAFPIVNLDLQMNRGQALQSARELAAKHRWSPPGYRQAVSFASDQEVQTFVELEGGGASAYRAMLREGLFSPYHWSVRHYKPGEVRETWIQFKPSGEPLGFQEVRSEKWRSVNVPPSEARAIAETVARTVWKIPLEAFKPIEQSQKAHPGGRIDHTFIYERPERVIGKNNTGQPVGKYRLRLVVSGNQLTTLTHFVQIPQAFTLRYKELRSANNTLSTAAGVAIALLYFLVGCIGGLFYLIRSNTLLWRTPVIWGSLIAVLTLFSELNDWPFLWMDYETALSSTGFLLQRLVGMLAEAAGMGASAALAFMVAEGLTRRAFPSHPQLWAAWRPRVGGSPPIIGRTLAGFLIVPLDLSYILVIYWVGYNWLGWWSPVETLIDPNVVATLLPWLSPLTKSLYAGFFEECLFRAVPLAGAALLGRRFGRPWLWMAATLVLQTAIFGAAHAGYATQPAYARMIELIIPSLIFAVIYLRFGLITGIVLHFVFDATLFSMPIFISSASGIWFSQLLVVLLILLPLWIVLFRLWQARTARPAATQHGATQYRATQYSATHPGALGWQGFYNRDWAPPPPRLLRPKVQAPRTETRSMHPGLARGLVLAGVVGLVVWGLFSNFGTHSPRLQTSRSQAETLAKDALKTAGFTLAPEWRITSVLSAGQDQTHSFIWRLGHPATYDRLLGQYLEPPLWQVRFTRFEGSMEQRAEEFEVEIDMKGGLYRWSHQLAESKPGKHLSREQARQLARQAVARTFGISGAQLEEVSAQPKEHPQRRDWNITYKVPAAPLAGEGQARIGVAITGAAVSDTSRYVFLPEAWLREEERRQNTMAVVRGISIALLTVFLLAGLLMAILSWSRGNISIKVGLMVFGGVAGLQALQIFNNLPQIANSLSPIEPVFNQVFSEISRGLLRTIFIGALSGLMAGVVAQWRGGEKSPPIVPWVGLSIGVLVAAVSAVIAQLTTSLYPVWGNYNAVDTRIPLLNAASDVLKGYLVFGILAAFVLSLINRWSGALERHRLLFLVAGLVFGFALAGLSAETLLQWLVGGLVTGPFLLAGVLLIFRFHVTAVVFAVAAMILLDSLKGIARNPFPGAIAQGVLEMVLVAGGAWLLYRWLGSSTSAARGRNRGQAVSDYTNR